MLNAAPIAHDASTSFIHDWPYQQGSLVAYDADCDPLTFSRVDDASHGQLTVSPQGYFEYTPQPRYLGDDSFTFKASDGQAEGNVATITIHVINHVPDTTDQPFSILHDRTQLMRLSRSQSAKTGILNGTLNTSP